jgi:uncharacterized protein (DUF849 family)
MTPLPQLMVAPTGVRRGKADHPALPVTIAEIVETAVVCHAAGAAAIHAHVRDADGLHSLDPGLYSELLAQLADSVPAVLVQVTTESGGRFSPADQFATVMALDHGQYLGRPARDGARRQRRSPRAGFLWFLRRGGDPRAAHPL